MTKKTAGRLVVALPLLLVLYLAIAVLWASASLGSIMAGVLPFTGATGLNEKQTAMLLSIEDPTFASHRGLSLADGQGLTTISSVVARELFLFQGELGGAKGTMQSFYRSVFDCCKKIDLGRDVTALVLNAKVSKPQQLAMYVSGVYMGSHEGSQIRGLEQAAVTYYGKRLNQLDDVEFASLVAMIKAPNQFHPRKNPALHAARLARIQAVASGTCKPAGWFDTSYLHCAG